MVVAFSEELNVENVQQSYDDDENDEEYYYYSEGKGNNSGNDDDDDDDGGDDDDDDGSTEASPPVTSTSANFLLSQLNVENVDSEYDDGGIGARRRSAVSQAALNAARMRKKSAIRAPNWSWEAPDSGESNFPL